MAGRRLVVARQEDRLDAELAQLSNRSGRGLLDRVAHDERRNRAAFDALGNHQGRGRGPLALSRSLCGAGLGGGACVPTRAVAGRGCAVGGRGFGTGGDGAGVAGGVHDGLEFLVAMRGGQRDARGLGGEVDFGLDAVELAELAFDAAYAGRAGHAAHAHGEGGEGQIRVGAGKCDGCGCLGHGGDRHRGRGCCGTQVRRESRDDRGGTRGLGLAHGVKERRGDVHSEGGQPRRSADQHAAAGGEADDAESGLVRERGHGDERDTSGGCTRRDRAGNGVLGEGLDGGGQGQGRGLVHLGGAARGGNCNRLKRHDARGDRARLVQEHGVDRPGLFEDFRVLDEDAQLRGTSRPDEDRGRCGQAERARACDDEDGDGRRERGLHAAAREQPADEGQQGNKDDDGHEHARNLVREALDGCLACLGLGNHAPDLCERRVRADARGAHQQGSPRVDGRARHRVAGGRVHGHGLAGQEGGIQGGGPLDDDAVGRYLLARAHREEVADLQGRGGHDALRALARLGVDAHERCLLRAHAQQRTQRVARAVACACLQVAARQQEHDDHARALEVDLRVSRVRRARDQTHLHAHAEHPGTAPQERPPAPQCRGDDAEGDQRVHRRRPVAAGRECRPVERPRAPRDYRNRGDRDDPLPPGELPGGHH